jgi:hypothetical protein
MIRWVDGLPNRASSISKISDLLITIPPEPEPEPEPEHMFVVIILVTITAIPARTT